MPHAGNAVLDFADGLDRCTSKDEATALFELEFKARGFDSFGCAEIPPQNREFAPGMYVSTMPEGWVERYMAKEYVQVDPMARNATTVGTPFRWSSATNELKFSTQEKLVMDEIGEFKVAEGFVVPIHGHAGYSGAVTFAGAELDLDPRSLNELHLMSIYAHNKLRTLHLAEYGLDEPVYLKLTARERECLHWAARGKSNWAISQILNISEHTVHEHIERAKKKYRVSTRVQAIVIGIFQGEIRP